MTEEKQQSIDRQACIRLYTTVSERIMSRPDCWEGGAKLEE